MTGNAELNINPIDAFYLILKNSLFYLASNILGIEWTGKIMDLFTSGPATSVLFILILARNNQWHSPDSKSLKRAIRIWLDVIENTI